jgi:hypothetical protein
LADADRAHLLIFDYVGSFPDVPPLPDGVAPDPREFGDRRVVVFITHSHSDHYSPEVFECPADLGLYERFRAEVSPRLTGTRVVAPSARGQWFRFEAGTLVPAAL